MRALVVFPADSQHTHPASQEAESAVSTPRQFSQKTSTSNMLRLKSAAGNGQMPYRVDFVLLEHFSMASFTVAMDVLVTANLLRADSFRFTPLSPKGDRVLSDLGLELVASELNAASLKELDLLVICGGLRTPLKYPELDRMLSDCAAHGMALGGCGTARGSSVALAYSTTTAAASIQSSAPALPSAARRPA